MLARPDGSNQAVSELLIWCVRSVRSVHSDRRAHETQATELGMRPAIDIADAASWSAFLREAGRHMVMPACWRALEPFRDEIPAAIATDLQTAFDLNTRRNLWLAAELVSMLGKLRAAGIEAVPWKGPLLAERAYGDLRLRQFFDLDVLVRRADLAAAAEVAIASGLRHEKEMTTAQRDTYAEHQGEIELVREADGLWLELHTHIVPTYYARGTTSDELWDRIRPARVARATVSGLGPVDELEALCVHGSKHRWDRLAWIMDIAMMSQLQTDADWSRLLHGAARHGTKRMVHLGLLLAVDIAGACLPEKVAGAARADRNAGRLATEVRLSLFDSKPSQFDALLFHARMRERTRDQLDYLFNVIFTPSGADWESLSLPRALFPVYALTRPVRLAVKYGRRVVAGGE